MKVVTKIILILILIFVGFGAFFYYSMFDIKASYITMEKYDPEEWERIYKFDNNNIVMVDYGKEIGIQYNPCTIAQYALVNYDKYIATKDDQYKTSFLNQVNFLVKNNTPMNDNAVVFLYNFNIDYYGLEKPWYSGLTQGNVLSMLNRAYKLTRNREILPLMVKTKNSLFIPTSQGGVLTKTPEGLLWIEEYPSKKPSLVLNGFVSTLIGLYDYLEIFPSDEDTKTIYKQLLESLSKTIVHYDTGTWLLYDRTSKPNLVNERYMECQTLQMKHLYHITGDLKYLYYYIKWNYYQLLHIRK